MKLATRYRERKSIRLGESNNMVIRLVLINSVIYVSLAFVSIIFQLVGQSVADFYHQVVPWAILPADLAVFITRPWTLITFMFVHLSFWTTLSNMLWLWWFGNILQDFSSSSKVVPLYLYGGLSGALFFLISYHLFGPLRQDIPDIVTFGASASIMAIAIASTLLVPDYRVFPMLRGGIPLWIITMIFVGIDFAGFGIGELGAYSSHLGGALMGWLFIWQLKKGNDWSIWLNRVFYWLGHLFEPGNPKSEIPIRDQLFYKHSHPPYRRIGNIRQSKVDEILDKINQFGYDSLTQDEKNTLLQASKEEE
ncbi:MAG: rhomboid family intramembrane serine protease [Chitinophagaceae bacterium]